jgi:hypothetical protein
MFSQSRTFRLFVSSTFSDLKAERDALQREVFPRLRELCLQHGCRFQAIDLRWGVSEEASFDQQTMNICLKELRRCQEVTPRPNFIILLGNRYGWRPLPSEIPDHEFEEILARVSPKGRDLLLWGEHQPDGRKGWYRRDDNAEPAVYSLRPRTGVWQDEAAWGRLERTLRDLLLQGIAGIPLSPVSRRRYLAGATAQEIEAGALDGHLEHEASGCTFCFLRNIEGLPTAPDSVDPEERRVLGEFVDLTDSGEVDQEAQRYLDCLRDRLVSRLQDQVFFYEAAWMGAGDGREPPITTTHLDSLCEDAYQTLSQVILAQIRLLEETSPLEQEIAAHDSFGSKRAASFLGRREPLAAIMDYLEGEASHPLAVIGPMGSGKSALLARALEIYRRRRPQMVFFCRFLGATPASSQGRSLLEGLCRQLSTVVNPIVHDLPTEFQDLVLDFGRRLAQAGPEAPLILFLDGLDQLPPDDPARLLTWLPFRLPAHVRLVVSTHAADDTAESLKRRLPAAHLVSLPPLPSEEACELLALWLEEAGRSLTTAQWRAILDSSARHGLPLYLKLAFVEARRWRSFDEASTLPSDVSGLIRHLFSRLSREDHHGRFLVSHSLGYLAAARHGLSEDELLEVLSRDEDVIGDFFRRSYHDPPQPHLPVVIWSRFFSDLEDVLTFRQADDTELLSFQHPQLSREAATMFLADAKKSRYHRCLASFFNDQPLFWREGDRVLPNRRKLSELAYQQALGGLTSEFFKTLTDPNLLEIKAAAGLSHDLLVDLDRALLQWDWAPLQQLRQALGQALPWMEKRPELALQFLFNRLYWIASLDQAFSSILPQWHTHLEARGLWLKAGAPLPKAGGKAGDRLTLETPTLIQSLAPDGGTLAAATADGVVEVRETRQGGMLDRRQLPVPEILAIALREDQTIAYLSRKGVIGIETSDATLDGHPGEQILLAHPHHGLLGLARDRALVAWNPEKNTVNPVASDLPGHMVALRLTPDGGTALFVAGQRPQVIGLSRWDGCQWHTRTVTHEGPPVADADLDSRGELVLLALWDRSLKLMNSHELTAPVAILNYETRPLGLRGRPKRVRFGQGEARGWAFFATEVGHLACWRWQEDLVVLLESFRRSITEPSFLGVFETLPETGRLFYSTDTCGREISRTDAQQTNDGHLVSVSSCLINELGQVVSMSEMDQTVRWFSADGLNPLACQTVSVPSALAPRPGSDEVFLGNSKGLLWVQSPQQSSTHHDEVMVQAEGLVDLVPLSPHQVLAVGKTGRIIKLDLRKKRSEVLWSGSGFRLQKKIFPAGGAGFCWSCYENEIGSHPLVIALVTGVNQEKAVIRTEENFIFSDAAVSPDGNKLALAGKGVEIYRLVRQGYWRHPAWRVQHQRQTMVKRAVFLGQGELLAVILADLPWLEVWAVEEGLATVAAVELPGEASCLAARDSRLVVGFASGDLMSLMLAGKDLP